VLFHFCKWLEQNSWVIAANRSILVSLLVYLTHYFSLFLIVGSMMIVDLGVLGVLGKRKSIAAFADQLVPLMWTGLCLNILSGFIMFSADATAYYVLPSFHRKLWVILLAVAIGIFIQRSIPKWDQMPAIPATGKFLALMSLILWVGSILAAVEVGTVYQNPT
jgi:hypothetical protein